MGWKIGKVIFDEVTPFCEFMDYLGLVGFEEIWLVLNMNMLKRDKIVVFIMM